MDHRRKVVAAFCSECVWAHSVRTHFSVLFESGVKRHELLAEVAKTFFGDLNVILMECVLLQQCRLTDPASSGKDKVNNLTTNYILALPWSAATNALLVDANKRLMEFRNKVLDARRKLVAHSDLKTILGISLVVLLKTKNKSSVRHCKILPVRRTLRPLAAHSKLVHQCRTEMAKA